MALVLKDLLLVAFVLVLLLAGLMLGLSSGTLMDDIDTKVRTQCGVFT
jgi:hypothetical protein